MIQKMSKDFKCLFADLLLVELRRQGVAQASVCVGVFMERLRVDDAGAYLAFGGLGIGDKEGIAVAEALLKLRSPPMMKTHGVSRWTLLLDNNSLADRSAVHLSLLLSRCSPPLVLLDVRGNAMTDAAVRRIEEARVVSSSQCILRLASGAPNDPPTEFPSKKVVSSSLAGSEALQRRRNALFRESGAVANASIPAPAAAAVAVTGTGAKATPLRVKTLGELTRRCLSVGSAPVEGDGSATPLCLEEGTPGHSSSEAAGDEAKQSPQEVPDAPVTKRAAYRSARSLQQHINDAFTTEEQFDVTANLNPLLNSPMDLSNMIPTGRLRELYGTDNIWDVVGQQGTPAHPTSLVAPFQSLTVLNISRNGLRTISVLPVSLLRLDVSENALEELCGLEKCRMLTLLNARRNRIRSMGGLENNLALSHLFLGGNEIAFVDGIAHLLVLETLDLAHNRLRTQASIRPLSLSKGLRRLMLRGNPVMDCMKHNYRPVLRNLCPSLLIIDESRLTPSRLSEGAQQDCSQLLHPCVPRSDLSDVTVTSAGARDEVAEASRCTSYMQLLTHGAAPGANAGYSDPSRVARAAMALQARKEEALKKGASRQHQRQQGLRQGGGESLRREFLKRLALESKKYLESMLVERLANMQQSRLIDASLNTARAGGHAMGPMVDPVKKTQRSELSDAANGKGLGSWAAADDDGEATVGPLEREESDYTCAGGVDAKPTTTTTTYSGLYAAGRRDETLNHNEWLQLRGRLGPRCVSHCPFGDTPCKASSRPATPEHNSERQQESALNISPIRKNTNTTQLASTNVTEILCKEELMVPRVGRARARAHAHGGGDGSPVTKKRVSPLIKADARRPMLMSPSSYSSPVKACRTSALSRPPTNNSPFGSQPRSCEGCIRASREPIFLSPPPSLQSPNVNDDRADDQDIREWVMQLYEDTEAVQDALRTVVVLLDTHRRGISDYQRDFPVIPECLVQERRQCMNILEESGMLLDTEVPLNVAEYYHFTAHELNCTREEESDEEDDEINPTSVMRGGDLRCERSRILHCVRLIGDAKTCLRYLALLIEHKREEALCNYVGEIKGFLISE